MYTITRKLTLFCLAVILSVLAYGCGGGSSTDTAMNGDDPDAPPISHTVITDLVVPGLTITPDTYTIQPGKTADAGDATLRCRDGGEVCVVEVVDNDNVTSTGGMAEALLSKYGILKLYAENEVNTTELAMGFDTIPDGTETIQPGKNMDIGDANFACPSDGVRCMVRKDEDGVTSVGGMATLEGYSMVAMASRVAIALSLDAGGALLDGESTDDAAPDSQFNTVVRSPDPDGVTTITLKGGMDDTGEYSSEAVDSGHEIAGWMGQTLKRDDGIEAMMEMKAVPAENLQEATVYTNIDAAEAGKWKVTGNRVPPLTGENSMVFAIDPGQEDFDEEFMGSYIRADGSRIHGKFTCDAEAIPACTMVNAPTVTSPEGNLLLDDPLANGWTFESDDNVKEGETPDADYMYFGYWLKSAVEPSETATATDYSFATFFDGGTRFDTTVISAITEAADALTANYEGGAAGRYVNRDLRVRVGTVDPLSPGSHGRFNAKAMLTAYFGTHAADNDTDPVTPSRQNMVHGTITDFMDGEKELDFEVTLGMAEIGDGTVLPTAATAEFGNVSDNEGNDGMWNAQFYGPNAAADATDAVVNTTLPTGIAGQFHVSSDSTSVVGAFAAEKK